MPGFRELGLAGAALALTGGVAYVFWNLRDTHKKTRGAEKVTYNVKQNPEVEVEEPEKLIEKEIRTKTSCKVVNVDVPQQGQTRRGQLLVLGLNGAGKTSLVQGFVTGSTEQEVTPTQGSHAVSVNKDGLHVEFLEIGGEEKLREYWPMYLEKARVLVFVLDAADATRFPQAKTSLHRLLASDPYLPLVLLANKQDLAGACGVTEVYESMALGSVCDGRKLCVLGTQVQKGSSDTHPSVQGAYELILDMMNTN
ncbi:ADP-ribosylation factor-like protein 9 [Bagarius yarrelli]|uniref:ADP-ribosylation factor-like protein 9 n=1 Tax=Bagarius yarrelli TaxID=175774 RepID=A0A556TVJ1_BAGYA|nr:ADP-ribosylation factor-like protein 9 [Bagarius yarrelli]